MRDVRRTTCQLALDHDGQTSISAAKSTRSKSHTSVSLSLLPATMQAIFPRSTKGGHGRARPAVRSAVSGSSGSLSCSTVGAAAEATHSRRVRASIEKSSAMLSPASEAARLVLDQTDRGSVKPKSERVITLMRPQSSVSIGLHPLAGGTYKSNAVRLRKQEQSQQTPHPQDRKMDGFGSERQRAQATNARVVTASLSQSRTAYRLLQQLQGEGPSEQRVWRSSRSHPRAGSGLRLFWDCAA